MRRFFALRLLPYTWVSFANHLFAKIHADEIVLKDAVVEHVLRRLAEIDNPFTQRRCFDPISHVLRVNRASRMVVAANTANTAGNKMRISRILVLHEDGIAAKDRGRAVTFRHSLLFEIDLRINTKATYDPRNGIPIHFDQVAFSGGRRCFWFG